jgi:hypothetical protein
MTEKEERRYSLGAPSNPREKNFTILHRKKFSLKRLERQQGMKVSLWNVSPPRWPGEANARMKPEELAILLKRAYDHSQERAHLVLWIPGPELHQTMLSPLDDVDPWMSQGTIFSGDKTGSTSAESAEPHRLMQCASYSNSCCRESQIHGFTTGTALSICSCTVLASSHYGHGDAVSNT